MKKINIIKSNRDFERIINNQKPYIYKDFIVYVERTTENIYRFGISIGKKVGKAVVRNRLKRQLKNIIDKKIYQKGFNCIIMIKKDILNKNFHEMEKDLNHIFEKIGIIEGENK
ncbi:MAG: ribonuclease P protein component [Mollicutes bacterium]|nr:ribonuclease P protein component [Mollicutes bacterium]